MLSSLDPPLIPQERCQARDGKAFALVGLVAVVEQGDDSHEVGNRRQAKHQQTHQQSEQRDDLQDGRADANGYVYAPNVNTVEEMVDMISASRSYQNNVEVMTTARNLMLATLKLGQG